MGPIPALWDCILPWKPLPNLVAILIFPSGLFLLVAGLAYEWADRKLLAQFQNRVGPRWFQPLADVVKLMAKEEIVPDGVNASLFIGLPIIALAGALTAALYVPIVGLPPIFFPRRSHRDPLSAQFTDFVHRARRFEYDGPLLNSGRNADSDPIDILRSALFAGDIGSGDRGRELADQFHHDLYQ